MTIFVCMDCTTGILGRYDASNPDGLTHKGRLRMGDRGPEVVELIREFRENPPEALRVHHEPIPMSHAV